MDDEEIELKYKEYMLYSLCMSLEDLIDYEILSFEEFKTVYIKEYEKVNE